MLKFVALLLSLYVADVLGHGMMMQPVGRQSRWRVDNTAPPNYNDNELFCGGIGGLWNVNNGKCGLCGDNYSLNPPRPHELGGAYGSGAIVGRYQPGQRIPVAVKITANHKGYFFFDICNLDQLKESEECFSQTPINISDGNRRYTLTTFETKTYEFQVQIPSHVRCNHCVLRWTYQTANNWGTCPDGTQAVGCGPQEIFKNCADISIL